MKPYRSSSEKENCAPTSSNCVIWQGPDLSCINLCKGDTVSDVVYKLATQVCDFQNTASLSDLNLTCLLDACYSAEMPPLTLAAVLQLIINKLCCSYGTLSTQTQNLTARTSSLYAEPDLVLPECLQYVDPATGLLVTTLKLSEYAVNTANALCDLKYISDIHTNEITDLNNRVTILENDPGYVAPLVTPSCTYGTVVQNVPTSIENLLSNLDNRVCSFIRLIGTTSDILSATASQCASLGSQMALSYPGTMNSIPGWKNNVSSFAQSMQNLWLTVCDMRAVIYDLKACCDTADCSQFLLGYTTSVNLDRSEVTLVFNTFTVIPSGFSNCPLLSTVTISDTDGHTFTSSLDLTSYATNPAGITFTVTSAYLNPSVPYTITVDGCLVKGTTTCSKSVTTTSFVSPTTTTTTTTTTTIEPTTTTTTTTVACTCYSWSVNINSSDLADAGDNSNPIFNGVVLVDWYACGSTSLTVSDFSVSGADSLGCSCLIPEAYYFKGDVKHTATTGTLVFGGLCELL